MYFETFNAHKTCSCPGWPFWCKDTLKGGSRRTRDKKTVARWEHVSESAVENDSLVFRQQGRRPQWRPRTHWRTQSSILPGFTWGLRIRQPACYAGCSPFSEHASSVASPTRMQERVQGQYSPSGKLTKSNSLFIYWEGQPHWEVYNPQIWGRFHRTLITWTCVHRWDCWLKEICI